MNVVFVKHGSSKEFAFYVPDELVEYVKKGDMVAVKTHKGLDVGTVSTGVISGKGAEDVAISKGAYLPLKPIVGVATAELKRAIRNEMLAEITELFRETEDGKKASWENEVTMW